MITSLRRCAICRVPPGLSNSIVTPRHPLFLSKSNLMHVASIDRCRIRHSGSIVRRAFHSSIVARREQPCNVRIGHVSFDISQFRPSSSPQLVPKSYLPLPSQRHPALLQHLQWMLSKDALSQDMLLVGPPGAGMHYRRNLALMYAEMTGREVEMLTLTSDITESDLKQRRELVHSGSNSECSSETSATVLFDDQAPVRAARHGRLLILDGLERVERNVLPTLNNLLENREMPLEDGRFLTSPERYEDLLREFGGANEMLVPVHKSFRVVALAAPSPPYPGQPLDPPLRSRFQIRRVDNPSAVDLYADLARRRCINDNEDIAGKLSAFAAVMDAASADFSSSSANARGRSLEFPSNALSSISDVMACFPKENKRSVLARYYPIASLDEGFDRIFGRASREASRNAFDRACDELGVVDRADDNYTVYRIERIVRSDVNSNLATVEFNCEGAGNVSCTLPCGKNELFRSSPLFVETKGTRSVLAAMMQEHCAGRDMLLLSPKGEGKSAIAAEFASMLGYKTRLFNAFREMTSRDLLMRRVTDQATRGTGWEESPLVEAARHGDLCILDGVDRLNPDTLGSLRSLMTEREIPLPDGRKLVRSDRFKRAAGNCADGKIIEIHPSFRVVSLGSFTKEAHFTEDTMTMFSCLSLLPPSKDCMRAIIKSSNPECPDSIVDSVLAFRDILTNDTANECGVALLSTRNLIRLVGKVRQSHGSGNEFDLYHAIKSVLLADMLPPAQRAALEALLQNIGRPKNPPQREGNVLDPINVNGDIALVGGLAFHRMPSSRPEMVPKPEFHDIPSQVGTIRSLLDEWMGGERSFLLLGNQGVGKNKIVDRLCEIANFEREYLQLHRDSTIGQITITPSIEDGRVVWKDSALIRAVRDGCILVVDEADKASVEVIAVLKSLVEDGELSLANGKRISRSAKGDNIISMHPNFTLFVLANRPGYPFLGQDLFGTLGDVCSTSVVANPDLVSQVKLLRKFGPDIDQSVLRSIARSFDNLRALADQGDIEYPFSTREAVAVTKHFQRFPEDGIIAALHNILDMDSFDDTLYSKIGQVFVDNGIEMGDYKAWRELQIRALTSSGGTSSNPLEIEYTKPGRGGEGSSSSPPPLSMPKQGKWDDNNEAHVGGNQWAGGTGGSDTAGLGGRGGPYRLDRGHKVYQVSDEAKARVSEEATKASREIARKALDDKLRSINISKGEWNMFEELVGPIRGDIANLRSLLRSVESKSSERAWVKRQSFGELDDSRLVEGLAGEKYVYKRRGFDHDTNTLTQKRKRLSFIVDVSGSMYRFNSYDGRLNRCLEAAALIMQSFDRTKDRFQYAIVGHSGDSPAIPLVDFGHPPANEKDQMRVLESMVAHSQYCQSGDHTLEAMRRGISDLGRVGEDEDVDENIVIAISDANLSRYGIHPKELGRLMEEGTAGQNQVRSYFIALASFGQEAEEIRRSLPAGRGYVCVNTSDLPRVVKGILTKRID